MFNNKIFNYNYEEEKIKYIKEKIILENRRYLYNSKDIIIYIIKFIFLIFSLFTIIYYKKIRNKDLINANIFKKYSKKRAINYMEICLKDILINNNKTFNINNFPKISVIIPVYNCEKYIKYTIRSIQNQNMSNFEIILINDNSEDSSLKIIQSLQKEDKRIKIYNNIKNMGTLYSRSIGALNAKGEYIFALDNDDMFCDEDIFDTIYNIAKYQNYDIVEFKTFDVPNYVNNKRKLSDNYFNHHPNNLILHQPELSIFPISKNDEYSMNDFHIWGKCIKSKLYKYAVNSLGKKRYSIYNCWTEDIIIILIIFKFADSFIFINKYGIIHMENFSTTTYNLYIELKLISEIHLLETIMIYLNNNQKIKKLLVDKALLLGEMNIIPYLNKTNRLYLKKILNKINIDKFISNDDKRKINDKFNITNFL